MEPKKPDKNAEETGKKYFSVDGDIHYLILPEKVTQTIALEAEGYMNITIKEMLNSGMSKLIMDLSQVSEVDMNLIKLIASSIENCQKTGLKMRVVGASSLSGELKDFKETLGLFKEMKG